ncbi:MAG TPA: phosphatidate cytidylyltransferase [Chloroflexi bacterium]|jgi:phosphatidate cytidylyltransferase|nr:phosphatidate cytidylyltransferase [Chloroflexota bacterium]HBV94042.1 phosphatidate cytidylyltransferase [Chloroflexota bacterium]
MNLLPRLVSSAVLICLVASMIWIGGIPLDVLIGVAAALAAWELGALLGRLPAPAPSWLVIGLAVWLAERAILPGAGGNLEVILPIALGAGMVAGVLFHSPWEGWAAGLGGGLYLGIGLGSLLGLYHWPGAAPGVGLRLVAIVVAAVVATDTLAYFTGHALGRHPFFPAISPKKSVEGAVGGAVGAVLVAGIAGPLVISLNPVAAVGMGLLIAVVAEGGDLAESALKRQADVKDSGRLIPGHGGLLDRLDGLLLAGPAVYCLLVLIAFR